MTTRVLFLWTCTVAVLGALAACDNAVDPFEQGTRAFAVYGYLDTARDTQAVRIEPVVSGVPLDEGRITVTLRDAFSGDVVTMQGEVVTLDDGTVGLVYRAPFRVRAGQAYALQVALDGQVRTTAATLVPPVRRARFEAVEKDSFQQLFLPLVLQGPTTPLARIEVTYTVATVLDTAAVPTDSVDFPVPYFGGGEARDGYRYRLQVSRDRRALLDYLNRAPTDTLRLLALHLALRDDGTVWTGEADGFGFFSSVSYTTERLVLPDSVLRRIGFAGE